MLCFVNLVVGGVGSGWKHGREGRAVGREGRPRGKDGREGGSTVERVG